MSGMSAVDLQAELDALKEKIAAILVAGEKELQATIEKHQRQVVMAVAASAAAAAEAKAIIDTQTDTIATLDAENTRLMRRMRDEEGETWATLTGFIEQLEATNAGLLIQLAVQSDAIVTCAKCGAQTSAKSGDRGW